MDLFFLDYIIPWFTTHVNMLISKIAYKYTVTHYIIIVQNQQKE